MENEESLRRKRIWTAAIFNGLEIGGAYWRDLSIALDRNLLCKPTGWPPLSELTDREIAAYGHRVRDLTICRILNDRKEK